MPDLSNPNVLNAYLARHHLLPKKSLGQNFLVDRQALENIISAAELTSHDRVLEIGAGPGVLSQAIAPMVKKLLSLDVDKQFERPWHETMKSFPNATLQLCDALAYIPDGEPYKLVANIPYFITSPILKHFLRHQQIRRPDLIVLLIQKEVAERIVDKKKPMLLSWEIKVFGHPSIEAVVKKTSFYPAPKVDSAILKIKVFPEPLVPRGDIDHFFKFLSVCYRQPRKTLLNNLVAWGRFSKEDVLDFMTKSCLEGHLRPHQLSLDQWKKLFSTVS